MISDAEMLMGMSRFITATAVLVLLLKYAGLTFRALRHPRGGLRSALRFLSRNGEAFFLLLVLSYYIHQMFASEGGGFRFPRFLPSASDIIIINLFFAGYFFFHAWPGRNRRYEDWLEQ